MSIDQRSISFGPGDLVEMQRPSGAEPALVFAVPGGDRVGVALYADGEEHTFAKRDVLRVLRRMDWRTPDPEHPRELTRYWVSETWGHMGLLKGFGRDGEVGPEWNADEDPVYLVSEADDVLAAKDALIAELRRQAWKIAELATEDVANGNWSSEDCGEYLVELLERAGFDIMQPVAEEELSQAAAEVKTNG